MITTHLAGGKHTALIDTQQSLRLEKEGSYYLFTVELQSLDHRKKLSLHSSPTAKFRESLRMYFTRFLFGNNRR
jgi:hypothetical protein